MIVEKRAELLGLIIKRPAFIRYGSGQSPDMLSRILAWGLKYGSW